MKKEYAKPKIIIEDFKIAQSISAGGCGAIANGSLGDPNTWDRSTCGWSMGNLVIWTDANKGCSFKWGKDDPWEGVCYNNPTPGNSIFSSY